MRARFLRIAVSGASMAPALRHGDWLIADRSSAVAVGSVVVTRDPRKPSRVIVKRVAAILPGGTFELRGDNTSASTDSRTFGAVSEDHIMGVVRWRYWPRPGRVR